MRDHGGGHGAIRPSRKLFGRVIFLATSNAHKFNEARRVLKEFNITMAMLNWISIVEVQDDDIETVAKNSANYAAGKYSLPILVEDAGLYIDALGGFPGPYSSYVYRTIGNNGILKLMKGKSNRAALFRSVIAFATPRMAGPLCFKGEVRGQVPTKEHGEGGFGFDPIFKPHKSPETFAEMTLEKKNMFSHRASAFREFAQWCSTAS